MPSSEERRTGARMPSLLTPAQQAEADRNRILTKLEHGKADPPAARPRSRKLAWGAGGAAALALIGGAAFWNGGTAPVAPHAAPMIAAANVAPARVEPPAVKPAEPEVSAAAILDEPAPAAVASPAPKVDAAAKTAPDDLRRALEEGTEKKHTPHKAVAKADAPKPLAKASSKLAPAAPRKAPAKTTPDSDVALLSALVAHTQASRGASDATPALKKELKACSRLKGSKARDCREEACLGFENSVAACK